MSKKVLITGASSGIGLECAKQFLEKNWDVYCFDLNLCPLKDVQSFIVDIRNEKDLSTALFDIKELDVLVNNAGVYDLIDIDNATQESVDKIVDTNMVGTYLVTKNCMNLIRKSKGSIIFISSGIGVNPDPTSPVYCATKAGINMLAKCLAISESANNVKINTILPGPIDTPMIRSNFTDQDSLKEYLKLNPNKRLGSPTEVANAVLFLAGALCPRNDYIVGTFLSVDGGESISSKLPKRKTDINPFGLEQRVNNYINNILLDFDNIVIPQINKDNIVNEITNRLCAKKWCHVSQTESAKNFTKSKVEEIINKNLPFIFSFCFGGYKHWWSPTSPVPDWAELYNLKYLYEYLAPLSKYWKNGITLQYESEEVGIEKMNNVPDIWQKQYTLIFKKLIMFVKSKIKLPLNYDFILASELYDKNKLFAMMEEYMPVVEKRFESLTPQEKTIRIKRAASNFLWKGKNDLTGLSDNEKFNYAKKSRLINEAFLDIDYELRGNTYFEKENLIPLLGTFGLGAGGESWLHLSSCQSSFVDFWSGIGILEVREEKIIEKILSRNQFEQIQDKLIKIPVHNKELSKIHKNFTWIYVYEGEIII